MLYYRVGSPFNHGPNMACNLFWLHQCNSFDGLASHKCLQLIAGTFVYGPPSIVGALSWLAPIM